MRINHRFQISWTTFNHSRESWQMTLTFLDSPCLLIIFFTYIYVSTDHFCLIVIGPTPVIVCILLCKKNYSLSIDKRRTFPNLFLLKQNKPVFHDRSDYYKVKLIQSYWNVRINVYLFVHIHKVSFVVLQPIVILKLSILSRRVSCIFSVCLICLLQ